MAPTLFPYSLSSAGFYPQRVVTFAMTATEWSNSLVFYLNGTRCVVPGDSIDPDTTLLTFIRSQGLTGTKLGCGEGGCGACTVVIQSRHPANGRIQHLAINACLAPLVSVDGKHVITVEGSHPHMPSLVHRRAR